jgi:hypothetical protein
MTRRRDVTAGTVTLTGRAWSGRAPLTWVSVSGDDGRTWTDAELGPQPVDQPWNLTGVANTMVQQVPVVVQPAG